MKKVLLSLFVMAAFHVNAQTGLSEVREVEAFTQIISKIPCEVKIVNGLKPEVEISGDEAYRSLVTVTSKGGKLQIKGKSKLKRAKNIVVTIKYVTLEKLQIQSAFNTEVIAPINSEKFDYVKKGYGSAKILINASRLNAKISGGGKTVLQGNCDRMDIKISGNAELDAQTLQVNKVNINNSSTNLVVVQAVESIDAKLSGKGNIDVYGNPEKKDFKIEGSGNVNVK